MNGDLERPTAVTREQATQALADIQAIRARVDKLRSYRFTAPYLILWGAVWFIANCTTDLAPARATRIWAALTIAGVVASLWISWRRPWTRDAEEAGGRVPWRRAAAFGVIFTFFLAMSAVLPPLNGRQVDATASLFWAFAYMFGSLWGAWRIFTVGLVTAGLILFGYFILTSHFFLWMGVVAGGALMFGGLWLRKL